MITSEAQKLLRQTPSVVSRFVRLSGGPLDGARVLADPVAELVFGVPGEIGHRYEQRTPGAPDFDHRGELVVPVDTAVARPMPDPARSPALRWRSEIYPERFGGRVPRRIRLLETPEPELPTGWVQAPRVAAGAEVDVWVNSHGAIIALLPGDECAALNQAAFEVVAWHPVATEAC